MFMMPYVSRITRSSFPFAVILLVVVNLIVYFVPQSMDEKRFQRAVDYYAQSVLPDLELPAYLERLRQGKDAKKTFSMENWVQHKALLPALHTMEQDEAFMKDLREGRVIREAHPQYWEWKQARQSFDEQNKNVFIQRFHFDTAKPSPLTAFSHQFLHGSVGHLVGNMIVLALVGPAVEALLGAPLFLLMYLASGVAGAMSHMVLSPDAAGGLVGASGAISGVMGAFAVLLGMRRIPFFYFLFVYFDVIKAPALLALPIWLINEAVQLLWLGHAHVAYGAHLGGLAVGALLAFPFRHRALARLVPDEVEATDKPGAARPSESPLQEARRLMTAQRFDEARRAYQKAAQQSQGNTAILQECLNVVKLAPASSEYHRTVSHLFSLRSPDANLHTLVAETFRDYLQRAKPAPKLDVDTLIGLCERFTALRSLPELERTVRLFHATSPEHPRFATVLTHAVHSLRQGGDPMRAAELIKLKPSGR